MKKKTISMVLSAAMIATTILGTGVIASADDEVTLKVFDAHAYGLDEYAEMVKAFEESHPGVKIEVQHAANDSNTLLQSRINSGDIPDVFDVESGTSAKKYYEYAYDWTDDTDVTSLFNEDALPYGAAVHATCAFNWLNKQGE